MMKKGNSEMFYNYCAQKIKFCIVVFYCYVRIWEDWVCPKACFLNEKLKMEQGKIKDV